MIKTKADKIDFMIYLDIDGQKFPVEIIYSSRRKKSVSFSTKIDENDVVYISVRAPEYVKTEQIIDILKKNNAFLKRVKTVKPLDKKKYNPNSLVCFKGKKYPIIIDVHILNDNRRKAYANVEFHGKFYRASVFIPKKHFLKDNEKFPLKNITCETFLKIQKTLDIESLIENGLHVFLKKETENYLEKEIENFCVKNNFKRPKGIFAGYYKSKWGSCTSDNIIKINYALLNGPEKYIKYIIAHEMCHIKVKNHSKEFWKNVEMYCPDYKRIRKELKENGYKLNL
ncbi:MAG: M48 family metallopeptidase [Methanosarcinaceae archaeon]|nr:M48 family metallopeptidase [Methanosarcinaceae archaeon]